MRPLEGHLDEDIPEASDSAWNKYLYPSLTFITDKPYVLLTPVAQLGWSSTKAAPGVVVNDSAAAQQPHPIIAEDVMTAIAGLSDIVSQALLELRTTTEALESLRRYVTSGTRVPGTPGSSHNIQDLPVDHAVNPSCSSAAGLDEDCEMELPPHEQEALPADDTQAAMDDAQVAENKTPVAEDDTLDTSLLPEHSKENKAPPTDIDLGELQESLMRSIVPKNLFD